LELAARQVDALVSHERLEAVRADHDLAGADRLGLGARGAAPAPSHHTLDARDDLLGVTRLGDPIVGAKAQAAPPLGPRGWARAGPPWMGPCRRRSGGPEARCTAAPATTRPAARAPRGPRPRPTAASRRRPRSEPGWRARGAPSRRGRAAC